MVLLAQLAEHPLNIDSFFWPNWRNGSAPAYGAGGCGFEPHVGLCFLWRVSSAVEQSAPVRSVVSSNPAHVFLWAFLAQSAERCANNFSKQRCNAAAAGSIPAESSFCFGVRGEMVS